MIEIPESAVLAMQLKKTFLGKIIVSATAAHTPHGFAFYTGNPASYGELLTGQTLEDTYALAGFLVLVLGNVKLILNDGINLRLLKNLDKLPEKHQLLLQFNDQTGLYCTISMYGSISLIENGIEGEEMNSYYMAARDKPSPLTVEFNESYFDSLVKQANDTITAKAFLATKQRIPGLGNGVLQDILFHAGIHPKSRIMALKTSMLEAMYNSIKKTLAEMTEQGGRNTEKNLFGIPGGYQTYLSAKTLRFPCKKCASSLVKEAYLGGTIYYCPFCQPKIS